MDDTIEDADDYDSEGNCDYYNAKDRIEENEEDDDHDVDYNVKGVGVI